MARGNKKFNKFQEQEASGGYLQEVRKLCRNVIL